MKIKIANMYEVFKIADAEFPDKLISLVDLNSPIKQRDENHIVVTFADLVELPDRFKGPYMNPKMIPILPAISHIAEVLEFTKDLSPNDYVLIHCAAGKSRSPAMAIAILMQHGMNYENAFKHILDIRPQAIPNQLMISLIDEYFNLNGELSEFYNEWYYERIKQVTIV